MNGRDTHTKNRNGNTPEKIQYKRIIREWADTQNEWKLQLKNAQQKRTRRSCKRMENEVKSE